jgi:hypothetical protein
VNEQRPGTRRAEPQSRPLGIAQVVLVVAILALVATLMIFGESIFDGGSEPQPPSAHETASPPVVPDDEEAPSAVARAATTVLTTWSRPGAEYAGWWRRLEPLLTPGGQQAYAYTDPAQLPDLRDVEVRKVVVHPPGLAATVYFTTSEGRYGVDLSRRAQGARWLANRVVFPGGESMFA